MDDETTKVEGQKEPVKEGLPTPTFTEETPASSPDLASLQKTFDEKFNALEKMVRGLQSSQDKTAAQQQKVSKALDDLNVLAEFKELTGSGLSEKEAVTEMRLRRLERSPEAEPAQPISGKVDAREVSAEGKRIVENMGLSIDDADVVSVFRGNYKTPAEFYTALAKVGVTKATNPTPTAAQTPPMSGGATGDVSTDDLIKKYNQVSQRDPFGAETKKLRKELEKRNWGM